jgi:hypothetical protein
MVDSIKIDVYGRDHPPPHFHAIYAEQEALIEINTLEIYAGQLPTLHWRKIKQWAKQPGMQALLLENFNRLNPHLRK